MNEKINMRQVEKLSLKEIDEEPQVEFRFTPDFTYRLLFTLGQCFSIAATMLLIAWIILYNGSFDVVFNYHPLFAFIGSHSIESISISIFRIYRSKGKRFLKLLHALLHFAALICILIATAMIIVSKGEKYRHFYSLHSWIGVSYIALFLAQFLASIYIFWLSKNGILRGIFLHLHVYFGTSIYLVGLSATLLGIFQTAKSSPDYSLLRMQDVMLNSIGILIVIHAFTLFYLLYEEKYRRQPLLKELGAREPVKHSSK